jgi:plastocyanin
MRLVAALLLAVVLAPLAEARAITIHAGTGADGSLYFRPASIAVEEGERVSLTLVNDDADKPHDWALLDYGGRDVEVYVRGGQSRTVNFTASHVGEFRIVCQVVGHKQQGMEGAFVVEDKLLVPGPAAGVALVALGLAAVAARRR